MIKYERFKGKVVVAVIMALALISCATFGNMTGKQKYLMARGTFNDAVKDYITWAKTQPEDVKVKLRENNQLIKDTESALDAWGLAYDSTDKAEAYASLSDTLFQIFVRYGIKIKEGP